MQFEHKQAAQPQLDVFNHIGNRIIYECTLNIGALDHELKEMYSRKAKLT